MAVKFKPKIPKALPKKVFTDAMKSAAKDTEEGMKADFEYATSGWNNPPIFESKSKVRSGEITINVFTLDKVFKFVDEGTKAHIIKPVKAKVLHWITPSGEDAFSKGHMVSGIKPRKITQKIQKETTEKMKAVFRYYLNEAAVLSGHKMK